MRISIAAQPNALGAYRYDVSDRGNSTFGFRMSPGAARSAAEEDGKLLAFAARAEQEEPNDRTEGRPERRERRERRGRDE
jgi:hypothetical protein